MRTFQRAAFTFAIAVFLGIVTTLAIDTYRLGSNLSLSPRLIDSITFFILAGALSLPSLAIVAVLSAVTRNYLVSSSFLKALLFSFAASATYLIFLWPDLKISLDDYSFWGPIVVFSLSLGFGWTFYVQSNSR